MKALRFAASVATLAGLAACHRQTIDQNVALSSFSMVIQRTENGIAAQCAAGCRWKSLTADCAGCVHRIDATGIGPASYVEDPAGSFAFNLQEFEGKLVATGIKGTAWKKLSWGCGGTLCSVHVDETGVGPIT